MQRHGPGQGRIANITLPTGQVVSANAPPFALIDDGVWWGECNFQETKLHRITPVPPAALTVDM